jgi:hypothetical protein
LMTSDESCFAAPAVAAMMLMVQLVFVSTMYSVTRGSTGSGADMMHQTSEKAKRYCPGPANVRVSSAKCLYICRSYAGNDLKGHSTWIGLRLM